VKVYTQTDEKRKLEGNKETKKKWQKEIEIKRKRRQAGRQTK